MLWQMGSRAEDHNRSKVETEVLNAFFASVFSSETSCPQGTQSPGLGDRDKEHNEAP